MGNAHAIVKNSCGQSILVDSYNNADKVYAFAKERFWLGPGQQRKVEAAADKWGLHVVAWDGDCPNIQFVKNGGTLDVADILKNGKTLEQGYVGGKKVNWKRSSCLVHFGCKTENSLVMTVEASSHDITSLICIVLSVVFVVYLLLSRFRRHKHTVQQPCLLA